MDSSFYSQKRFVHEDIDIFVERPIFVKKKQGNPVNEGQVIVEKQNRLILDSKATKKVIEQNKMCSKTVVHKNNVDGGIILHPKELKGFYEDCRRLDNVLKTSKALMRQIQNHHNQTKAIFPEFVDVHKKLENAAWNVKAYMKLGEERSKPQPKFITSTQEDDLSQIVRGYKKEDKKRKRVEKTYDSDNGSIRSGSDVHFSDEDDEIESDSVYDPDNTQNPSSQSTVPSTSTYVSD